jgi:type I restriction enzyme S subunit
MGKKSWVKTRLADVCDSVEYGFTQAATDVPEGPKFLRITDIVKEIVDWASVPYCQVGPATAQKYRLRHGDIVIARTGASTGSSAYISHPPPAVFASYLIRLRINKKADSRFVSYFLKSPKFWRYIESVRGDKSAQPNASAKTLTQVELDLPALEEQRAISSILAPFDEKIELNYKMSITLEKIARAIFKHWFINFEFPNEEGKPYKSSGGEMLQSDLGPIPRGWRIGRLRDIAQNSRRSTSLNMLPKNTPYIGLEHMPRNSIALDNWGTANLAVSSKLKFFEGEILFGKLRPYFHKVGIAAVDGVCSTDILVITAEKSRWLFYVLLIVSSDEFIEYSDSASTGTRMPRTNWEDMSNYEVRLPPEDLISKYDEFARPLMNKILSNIHENRTLSFTRDSLLPKLMRGTLRLKDSPANKFDRLDNTKKRQKTGQRTFADYG